MWKLWESAHQNITEVLVCCVKAYKCACQIVVVCWNMWGYHLQVLDGGENLLEVVDKLTAEAAAQETALQAQKDAEAVALSRIAQLEEEHLHIEEQYSSIQVSF